MRSKLCLFGDVRTCCASASVLLVSALAAFGSIGLPPDIAIKARGALLLGEPVTCEMSVFSRRTNAMVVSHIDVYVGRDSGDGAQTFPPRPTIEVQSPIVTNLSTFQRFKFVTSSEFVYSKRNDLWHQQGAVVPQEMSHYFFPSAGRYVFKAIHGGRTSATVRMEIKEPTGYLGSAWAELPKQSYIDLFRPLSEADYRAMWLQMQKTGDHPEEWNGLISFARRYTGTVYASHAVAGIRRHSTEMQRICGIASNQWPPLVADSRHFLFPPPNPWDDPKYREKMWHEFREKSAAKENAVLLKYFSHCIFIFPKGFDWKGSLEWEIKGSPTNEIEGLRRDFGRRIRKEELAFKYQLSRPNAVSVAERLKVGNFAPAMDGSRDAFWFAFLLRGYEYRISFEPADRQFLPFTTNLVVSAVTNVISVPLVPRTHALSP